MGRPAYPTIAQIEELCKAAAQSQAISKESLTLTLQPQAVALIEIGR